MKVDMVARWLVVGLAVATLVFIGTGRQAMAEVKPHALISDNMVLQAGVTCPVWGTAEPGEAVTVTIGGETVKGKADTKGKWMVKVGPLKTGGPLEMTIAGQNTVTVKNILVGEVWLGSGQSNMNFSLAEGMNAEEEIRNANYPEIRFFYVNDKSLPEPVEEVRGHWRICTPGEAKIFSAVAYFFARNLHQDLKVPVGIIQSSHGASPAEAWTEAGALKACIPQAVERWDKINDDYNRAKAAYEVEMAKIKAGGQPTGGRTPKEPSLPRTGSWVHKPSGFWNGAIAPLIPYAIKGVIWYQGESNTDTHAQAEEYHKLLPAMITSWRKEWGEGDFPFLIVELAPYLAIRDVPTDSDYALVREAQRKTAASVVNTGIATTTDIGAAKDPHPKNKQDVGKRLALVALAKVYGRDVVYSGPVFKSMKMKGKEVEVTFEHVHGGLVVKDGEALKGFAVAGKDKNYAWAQARIEGDRVVVWSDEVAEPVAVRYAWASNPVCNLFNGAGLPAFPFRTDDWKQNGSK